MRTVSVIKNRPDVFVGAGLAVVGVPMVLKAVGGLVDLGQYSGLIVGAAGAVASGLVLGQKLPGAAAAVAGVFAYYAVASLLPRKG